MARSTIPILHHCHDFLVVDKPFDLKINSNDPTEVTLATILAAQLPHLVDKSVSYQFRFVHRLDYATSGCLLLALNSDAARRSYYAFNPDQVSKSVKSLPFVRKYYLALVTGHLEKPTVPRGVIKMEGFVGEDTRTSEAIQRRQMSFMTKEDLSSDPTAVEWYLNPKPASSGILVLEHGRYSLGDGQDGYAVTKVLVRLQTGRRHQIRTQCLQIGHPILGDYTYGGDVQGENGPPRMYLHAWKLRVSMPGKIPQDEPQVLNIVTDDPFVTEKTNGRWKCDKVITPLDNEAITALD